MTLTPLAVLILVQLGLILLGLNIFQWFIQRQLKRELASRPAATGHDQPRSAAQSPSFDPEQAQLYLNRLHLNAETLQQSGDERTTLSQEQRELSEALASLLGLSLTAVATAPAAGNAVAAASQNEAAAIPQEDLTMALDDLEPPEDFVDDLPEDGAEDLPTIPDDDLMGLDVDLPDAPAQEEDESGDLLSQGELDDALAGLSLDNSAPITEEDTKKEKGELPEDALAASLDDLDEFDFGQLEEALMKDDNSKL
ncbi:hypothetical protein BFW38_10470 [Terasakiispira papahanaumokuakeensis]|uniref:Uncharacterized protein n=1 Tax=Terasakiispira papahanaumokuakeensis TaxID=197479 RepID=A0A1E2VB77_9GAMM|nr:hypothetical protein [Terasakiispira papahanaumokuakeensis]ODC03905.1 hypothetical protein BFW38_10470 [Terasakiispira papahanaumokuakeensis]